VVGWKGRVVREAREGLLVGCPPSLTDSPSLNRSLVQCKEGGREEGREEERKETDKHSCLNNNEQRFEVGSWGRGAVGMIP
jgi:hypothetical protein